MKKKFERMECGKKRVIIFANTPQPSAKQKDGRHEKINDALSSPFAFRQVQENKRETAYDTTVPIGAPAIPKREELRRKLLTRIFAATPSSIETICKRTPPLASKAVLHI